MAQHTARLQLTAQHGEEGGNGRRLLVTQQVGIEQRAVEGDEPGVTADRQMQRGDVAVADKRLGVAAQQIEVDPVQQARRAVATAQTDDRVNFRVGERGMQVIEANVIAAGQVAVLFVDTGKHPQPVTPGAHPLHGFFGVQRTGPGRGDHANQPFGWQCRYRFVGNEGVSRSNGHPWVSLRKVMGTQ